jgi:putative multicomponent Na+:H+ antiporter subunit B
MMDSYIYIITALLPLAASMVVFQVNPYHALVIRGILGAIAALVYTVLGAADVALTEALVGTLLVITLYAVAVRSSLVMRLGVLTIERDSQPNSYFQQIIANLNDIFCKHHMQVEPVYYTNKEDLDRALMVKEVHAICVSQELGSEKLPLYHTTTRLRRLYEIMQPELESPLTTLAYANIDSKEKE